MPNITVVTKSSSLDLMKHNAQGKLYEKKGMDPVPAQHGGQGVHSPGAHPKSQSIQ